METTLWAIAVKGDQSTAALKSACEQLATVHTFKVTRRAAIGRRTVSLRA